MNSPARQASLFLSLSVLAALLATTCLAPAQAVFIRADNSAAMNTANAWLTNGSPATFAPGLSNTVVFDSTVSAANAVGTTGGAVSWGQIIVSNSPAPVEITNNNAITLNGRIFNGTTNGLTLDANDLSIVGGVVIRSNQTWTLGTGRTLTLAGGGGEWDIFRSLTFIGSGTVLYDRNTDVLSNSIVTIPAGISILSTNGTGLWRIAQNNNGAGTVNQNGGTVVLARNNNNQAITIGQNSGSTGTWNISAGTLTVIGEEFDGSTARIDNQNITLCNAANATGILNITGTGQVFVNVLNAATPDQTNQTARVNVRDTGTLTARASTLGSRGEATLTITNTAVVTITNITLGGVLGQGTGIETNGAGVINLDGGTLVTGSIGRGAGTNDQGGVLTNRAIVNFNGGLLQIERDNLNFSGPNALGTRVGMFVRTGGARIDTAGFSITNNAPLLHGTTAAVDPGLIKTGLGRLSLMNTNTYNGPTVVNAGELGLGTAHDGGGSITLANNTGLAVEVNEVGGTAPVSTLTFGTGGTTSLEIQTSTNGNPTVPVITATNLVTSGTINVTIKTSGDGLTVGQFVLIDYSGAIGGAGFGAFNLVQLPLGVSGGLIDDGANSRILLDVTDVPEILTWNGNVSGNWTVGGDLNWIAPGPVSAPFGPGAPVIFDDNATGTTTITLNTNVIPGGFNLLFNHSVPYSITGSGSISGTFGLIKTNTGTLTLGTSNDYPFSTIVGQGTLKLAGGTVIPDGVGKSGLILNGTLDLNGNTEAVNGFDGSSTAIVDNTAGGPATLIVGSNGASGTFLGTIQDTGGPLTLVKVGGGTNRLFSANSHSGGNIFLQGITELTNGSALGSSSAPLSFGGTVRTFGNINNTAPTFSLNSALTLNLSNNAAVTISGNIVGSNLNPTFTGSGSVTLTGANGHSGGFRPQTVALTTTGVHTNSTDVLIGSTAGGVASWVVNGGRVVMDTPGNDFRVGVSLTATGTLHVTNNAEIFYQDFMIALDDNSTGRVYQTSGIITNQEIGGGEVRFAGNNAAADAGTRAEYYLSGNSRFYSGALLSIGENGIALVSLSDTAQMVAQNGATQIGRRTTNAVGTLTVNAGTSFTQLTNALNVGNVGTGTLNVSGTVTVAPGNNLAIGVGTGGKGTVNLNPGGLLRTSRIIDGTGNSTFNFYGGTLEATGSSPDYMRNISNIVINSSGAFIDTGANDIGILVSLQEDAGDPGGGLTKTNTGSLTLGGSNNTYTGNTVVQGGRLILTPPYGGLSPITIADGQGFGVTISSPVNTVTNLASLDLGSATGATIDFNLGAAGNPSNAVLTAGTVTPNGTVTINVAGGGLVPGTFTLIDYSSLAGGGFGAFAEGTYPRGVDADLVDNFGNGSIDLQINSVNPVLWTGATDNIWDTNTLNWSLLAAPTLYIDGDSVLFPEGAANTSIQIVSNWSPLGVVVSNAATTYTFNAPSNTGIIGPTAFVKQGPGLLNLGSSNRYSGVTTISQGTVRFLTNDVLPSTGGILTLDGVLDANGFNDTVTALNGTGVISNGAAGAATLSFGGGGGSGSFSGTVVDTGLLTLRKTGGGTNELLTASPTWNGGATIDAGTLAFGDDLALGVGPILFEGSATLATRGSARSLANAIAQSEGGEGNFDTTEGDLTLTGAVNWYGSADMNKNGSNTMTLSSTASANLGDGAELAINGGSLIVSGASIVITNDGFRLRATTNFTSVDATIQGAAALTLKSNANFVVGATANANLLAADLTNTLTYTSGTTVFEGNGGLFIGSGSGNYGVFHHNGGTITFSSINTAGVTLGNATNTVGIYNLNAGALLVTSRVRENNTITNAAGTLVPELLDSTFRINGGTLKASSGLNGTNFMFGLDRAYITAAGAIVDTDTFDIDFNQALLAEGGGALTKNGTGSLALNGVNTYTGATLVNAGVLRGKGTVPTSVTGAGKIGGGDIDELGTLTVNGSVSVTGGAVMRVSHVGAVLSNDKVSATGSITHSGQLTLIAIGTDFAAGDQFDLFDATGGISGGFTSYNLGLLPPGLSWDARDVSTTGIIRIVKTTQVMSLSFNGSANQVTLSGMGPEASTGYRVLTSTNMADPINLWTNIAVGVFDGTSNFNSVINVNGTDNRRFFIIINP